jgi:hypothetical protein
MATHTEYPTDPRNPVLTGLSLYMGGFLLALGLLQEWANIATRLKYGRPDSSIS